MSLFSLIEDVHVVGYPDGIWDSFNNLPMVRKGITATPLIYNFQNQPEFLIDASIYGGSSGSPVYILNEGSYGTQNGLALGSRLRLIGIVYAVAQHTVAGSLEIQTIPTVNNISTTVQIPNDLGVVIKATCLFDFETLLGIN